MSIYFYLYFSFDTRDGLMCDQGPEPPSLDTTLLAGYVGIYFMKLK